MMKTRRVLWVAAWAFLAGSVPGRAVSAEGTSDSTYRRVSLIELIAHPEAYDGVKVSVVGYLNTHHEDEAIYLSREDYENYLPANSVRVALPTEGRMESGQFAIVEGVFRVDYVEHTGQMGEIRPLARVEPWSLAKERPPREEEKRGHGCW